MAMAIPSWLYYFFGGAMLAVAAYCLTLITLAAATNRPAGRDVEVSHVFMGVAMAGMFVGRWSFGSDAIWEIIFGGLMIWFLVASVQSIQRWGFHLPHALVHALMNFAMLLMYWFPAGASSGTMSMSMSAGGGVAKLDPGLGLLIVFLLLASAVFTLASPVKGRSHFGSHAPAYAVSGSIRGARPECGPGGVSASVLEVEEAVAAPWLVDVSHVVMCVAMAFLIVVML
jgi:hypothetical protein